jgi:hypothetical protein
MTMSRIFLMVLAVGALVFVSTASADVPGCSYTTIGKPLVISCPAPWGSPNHVAGSYLEWTFTLYQTDGVTPLDGFDCLRLNLGNVDPDSICVCDYDADFQYVYPAAPTNALGVATFRPQGTILNTDSTDPIYLEVCGCPDLDVSSMRVSSPDVNQNCSVGLEDFVIFSGLYNRGPAGAQPVGFEHYTIYTNTHRAPLCGPGYGGESSFITFSLHWNHNCTEVPYP